MKALHPHRGDNTLGGGEGLLLGLVGEADGLGDRDGEGDGVYGLALRLGLGDTAGTGGRAWQSAVWQRQRAHRAHRGTRCAPCDLR